MIEELEQAVAAERAQRVPERLKHGRVFADIESNSLIFIGDAKTLKLVRWMVEFMEEQQPENP